MGKKDDLLTKEFGKVPPQAIDIEEAVLGALLLEGSYKKVSHLLKEPTIFYKDAHNMILEAIISLNDNNVGIDLLTVKDELHKMGKLEQVGGAVYLAGLMSRIASDKHILHHCMVITDKYLLRELIRIGAAMQEKAFSESTDPNEIAEWVENELQDKFDIDVEGRVTFKDALKITLQDILDKQKGITTTFIKTGDNKIDTHLSLRTRQICLIAGAEGCGKTKYVTYLVKGMLTHNENVAVLWFSMEDSKEQIVRSFLSMDCRLTSKQLQSINYKMTADNIALVNKASEAFYGYKIEFVDHVCSIQTIMRKTKQFKDRHKGSMLVVVIDNLGLVSTDAYYKGVEKDDYLAGKIKELSDQTEASIILLHHLTKESAKALNLKEGYRPRKEHIRGSSRILDYVQQGMMVNLPRKYKDLVLQEKAKSKLFDYKERTGSFDFERFLMEFWNLNKQGDSNTKGIGDLRKATWDELKYACTLDKLDDGSKMGAGYVLKKYTEYMISVEDKNRLRQPQYHEKLLSIYTFIHQKMYHHDYSPKNDSRTYYLYGDNIQHSLEIKNLFIAEIVKNRDGSDSDDENLIRYKSNLDYNIFELLDE